MSEPTDTQQFELDTVVNLPPDELSDEQKTFLNENSDKLTDEQAETFGIERNPPDEKVEPAIRSSLSEPSKKSATPGKDDDEIDPDDEATIGKVVEKKIKPITEQYEAQTKRMQELEISRELDSELSSHPEYKPYEKRIREFVNHQNRKSLIMQGLPVSTVVLEAVSPFLEKIGAQKERDAALGVSKSKGVDTKARDGEPATKNWLTAPKEEFEAERTKVLSNQG